MATGAFDWNMFMTGWNPSGGGTDIFGNPIPMQIPGGGGAQGIAGVVGGVADLLSYRKDKKQQEGYLSAAKKDVDKYKSDFASGLYDQRVAQAQRDLAMAGVRPTDTSGIQSSAATALQAASADPRVLGGLLGNIQRNQAQQMQQQQMADVQREIASKSNLANLEQSVLAQNIGLKQNMGMMGLAEATAARNQALQNLEQLKQNKRDAFGNIIGGAADIGMTLAGMPQIGGMGAGAEAAGAAAGLGQAVSAVPQGGGAVGNLLNYLGGTQGGNPLETLLKQLSGMPGAVASGEKGMKVQKTPGEFSHKNNPIDIMQNGKKVGEMTGGEYVINPDQADAIEDAYEKIAEKKSSGKKISRQELMMLYDVIRGIFSQPQFKEEEEEEEEDEDEMED
jgi:hypothetical protein